MKKNPRLRLGARVEGSICPPIGIVAEDVLTLVATNDDVRNPFIIDASVFVTSGGLNPPLRFQANAFHVSDHLVAEAQRGNVA